MILDSSVILGVVFQEPGYEQLVERLRTEEYLGVGAPTLAESGIVLGSRVGYDKVAALLAFVQAFQVEVIAFSEQHWQAACTAYQVYGKGRHAAGLNFGDCMSYATAKVAGHPLFYVGNDFALTDLR